MEQKHQEQHLATDKVLAFDTIFTTNHIKMLKILVSFLPPSLQKMLAIYIKFLELQFTLTYFDTHSSPYPKTGYSGNFGELIGEIDLNALCNEILPYCTPDEKNKVNQFIQMQQMLDSFQQISQMMEMMKDLFPDGVPGFNFDSGDNSSNSQMFDILSSMMNIS